MTNEVVTATNGIVACVGAGLADSVGRQAEHGRRLAGRAVAWLAQNGPAFLVNVVVALLLLLLGGLAVKLLTGAVRKALVKSHRVNELLEKFICSVVNKAGWAVVLMVVLQRLGVDVGPLVAGLGVTGFILGFAFQESLGNLASGMMIALNQPFKVGDYVIAGGVEGSVLELNMMAAVLATADNKKIVVPNKTVWGGPITNFSALGKRRVDLAVSVAYGSDLEKAKRVAREALAGVAGVLAEPAPTVEVVSLADSSIVIAVRPWSSCGDYWAVYFAAQQKIMEAYDANKLKVPFPQLDVHLDK